METDDPTGSIQYPTWKKYMCIYATVARMSVREKRKIFAILRSHPNCTHETLLAEYGITLGDFCCFHVLSTDTLRK